MRGTAASVILGVCGSGLGLVCCWTVPGIAAETGMGSGYATTTVSKGDRMPSPGAGASITVTKTVPGRTTSMQPTRTVVPVETVTARPVTREPIAKAPVVKAPVIRGPVIRGPVTTASLPPQQPAAAQQKATTIPRTPPARPAAIAPAPVPAAPVPQPPRIKTAHLTPPAATATDDDGLGDIQWSSAKQSGSTKDAAPHRPASGARLLDLAVPLRDGAFYLGDMSTRVAPGGSVSVGKERLVQVLSPLLRPQALAALKATPDADGYVTLDALKAAGFDAHYDSAKVEMTVTPSIEQRATGQLSLASNRASAAASTENLSHPATIAAYMNMRAGANYANHSFFAEEGTADARVGLDGATRLLNMVFESAATYDMEGGFTRGSSRLVYDLPDRAVRLSAGDVAPGRIAMQGGSDLLGLSIEKSYQKLQPGTSIHPTGSQSFRVERPSNVDVMVNGHLAQKLHLRPGDYDMNDLPLASGANDIVLIIEDDLGHRRTLNFSVFSGRSLLAPGISQWGFSAGIASHYGSRGEKSMANLYSDLEYDTRTPVATGYYERGLTPDITGNLHAQADPDIVMAGAGASMQTRIGFWTFDGAASNSMTFGSGYAARVGYELVNIEGPDAVRRSFRLAADHRSEMFATAGAVAPQNDAMLALSASYSQDLPWQLSGSLSGSYTLGRANDGDRYGVDVSLGRSFGRNISAGLNAGYEQATETRATTHVADGFKAAVRLSYRVDDHSSIDAAHDARYGNSQVTYRHQEGSGVGAWSAQAELDRTASDGSDSDRYAANGSFAYTANRADFSLSHHTGLAGLDTTAIEQRTSLTAGTALAFADGHVAIGRPISSGFAIVTPHANLPGSTVAIGASQEGARTKSDFLGPALMSDVSPYAQTRVPVDVSNLPPGYDLGAGAFELSPRYKDGYILTVGSDYTVSVSGSLLDAQGKPITLLTGEAREEGAANSRTVTVFTTRTGKFAAQGLRPGRWVLDMATEPKTRFVLDIPKDTVGLFKAGTLKPNGAAQ